MKNLNEGLRPNDLKSMVSNVISIDEYKSKIDDTAVVIAFMVKDKSGAEDLNRYIQKSYVDLLDTEVSSAPDQTGSYLVFVELPLNTQTPKSVGELCDDLKAITSISTWNVRMRGAEAQEDYSPSQVAAYMNKKLQDQLKEAFSDVQITRDILSESTFTCKGDISSMDFTLVDYGVVDSVIARNKLSEQALDMTYGALMECRSIQKVIGTKWNVEKLGEYFAIYRTPGVMLLIGK